MAGPNSSVIASRAIHKPFMDLLNFPEEILLNIAREIGSEDNATRNEDLSSLALTHPRLRLIAREVLVCQGVVYYNNIHAYIAVLAEQPAWKTKIKRLEVRDCERSFRFLTKDDDYDDRKAAVVANFEKLWRGYKEDAEDLRGYIDRDFGFKAWLVLLIASVPNMEHLKYVKKLGLPVPFPFCGAIPGDEYERDILAKQKPLFRHLTSLNVQMPMYHEPEADSDMMFNWLEHLKSLSINSYALERSVYWMYLFDFMPPNLEILQIFVEDGHEYRDNLQLLHEKFSRRESPHFRQVQFYVRLPVSEAVSWFMDQVDYNELLFQEIMDRADQQELTYTLFFLKPGVSSTIDRQDVNLYVRPQFPSLDEKRPMRRLSKS